MKSRYPALTLTLSIFVSGLWAQTEAVTPPVGVLSYDVPAGFSGLNFPLIARDVVAGRLAASTATTVSFENVVGAVGPQLVSGAAYYLEILDGNLAGERLDVDTAATIAAGNATVALAFGAGSRSTLDTLSGVSLAGARAVVRPHVTLAALAAMFTPALTGNDDAALADGVRLYEGGGFTAYHLAGDGATWLQSGSATDYGQLVLAPDASIILELKSGSRQLAQAGVVRTTAFRTNLASGYQAYASGFPVDLTPAGIGGAVDAGRPAGVRWQGSDNAGQADSAEVFDPAVNSFRRFYLRGDGTGWRQVGDATNYAGTALFKGNSMVLLRRANADATYKVLPPFSL